MEEGAPCFSCLFQYDLDSDYRGNLFSAYGQCAKYLGGTCFVSCEGLDELVAKGCSKETGAWNVDIRSIPDDEEGFEDDYGKCIGVGKRGYGFVVSWRGAC